MLHNVAVCVWGAGQERGGVYAWCGVCEKGYKRGVGCVRRSVGARKRTVGAAAEHETPGKYIIFIYFIKLQWVSHKAL
jgi:hypothetical protein